MQNILNPQLYKLTDPQICKQFTSKHDTSDIPSDLHYIFVVNTSRLLATKNQIKSMKTFIITYKDENTTTIKDIKEQYRKQDSTHSFKNFIFTLYSGAKLYKELTMKQVKTVLARDSIDGLVLFIQIIMYHKQKKTPDQSSDSQQIGYYDQKCPLQTFMLGQAEAGNKKSLKLTIEILQNEKNEYFDIQILGDKKGSDIIDKIIFQIDKQYKKKLNYQDLTCKMEISKLVINHKIPIMKHNIGDKSKIIVELKDKNIKLIRPGVLQSKQFITIYGLNQKEGKLFNFKDIQDKEFQTFHDQQLKKHSILSNISHDSLICLKVMGIIVKPRQKLKVLSKYFDNGGKQKINIVGRVINSAQIFFYIVDQMQKNKIHFDLDQVPIPQQQESTRMNCTKQIRKKAKNTQHNFFKRQENIEPIYIYTMQLKCLQKGQTNPQSIYKVINQYLRKNPILNLDDEQINKQWKYKYVSTLIRKLRRITPYSGKVFRGISYNPRLTKDGITTFTQFISTSTKQSVSSSSTFMKQSQNQYHIFQMQIKKGYPIQQFSAFNSQSQILVQPFTTFKVGDIKQQKKNGKTLKRYFLYQIDLFPKQMPKIIGHFIIWIDDKPQQGLTIYQSIKTPHQTCVLVQLGSTSQLQLWLEKYNRFFSQQSANVILITNMTRKQGNVYNEIAGIDGLRLIKKYRKQRQTPICFFIWDQKKCQQKLIKNNIQMNKITITKELSVIKKFIVESMKQK